MKLKCKTKRTKHTFGARWTLGREHYLSIRFGRQDVVFEASTRAAIDFAKRFVENRQHMPFCDVVKTITDDFSDVVIDAFTTPGGKAV
jgi:hypothetical protein